MTHGQVFGLVRIATGGECIVSRTAWDWLIEKGAAMIRDGVAERNPQRAYELLLDESVRHGVKDG